MKKVVSVEVMRTSDRSAINSAADSRELMYKAGQCVFDSVQWHGKVAIACGSGNNAGDGYVLALLLKQHKIPCTLILVKNMFSEDGLYYFEQCKQAEIEYYYFDQTTSFDGYDFIVDCIYGTGFKGVLKDSAKLVIKKINDSTACKISVDINSGLNGDNGLYDEECVHSDLTISIGTYKSGLFLGKAKDNIDKLINCDIGIDIVGDTYGLWEASDAKKLLPLRAHDSNKGSYGYVAIVGGSTEYSGAAKLANLSLSALRAGAGVAKLAVPKSIANGVMPYILESTLFTLSDEGGKIKFSSDEIDLALRGIRAVAIGMGLGKSEDVSKLIQYVLMRHTLFVIIDADGINALSQTDLAALKQTNCRVILTPHPKEFERLCGRSVAQIAENPIYYARKFAAENNVVLLLKGATTIITDGKTVYLTDTGAPGMATAGSGDVLSGIILGLLGYNDNPLDCAAAGAYIAGLAGEYAEANVNPISMIASDTVAHIPDAVSEILKS